MNNKRRLAITIILVLLVSLGILFVLTQKQKSIGFSENQVFQKEVSIKNSGKSLFQFDTKNYSNIKTEETNDFYKITIDLKPFDNDSKNVNIKVKNNKVTISAQYQLKNKNEFNSSQFYQSLTLPEKIDTKDIKQEIQKNYLIITIPKIKNKKP